MDGDCVVICHLQCEISSVSVTGLGCSRGELFLRCHVPAGGGRAIQIDSLVGAEQTDGGGETMAGGGAVAWRDVASLSCDGSPACVRQLVDQGSVVFEVRRRRGRAALLGLGRVLGSELVGRAKVPLRDAGELGTTVERRVDLATTPSSPGDAAAAPVLNARISVRVSETAAPASRRRADSSAQPENGCEWSVGDEDVFAAVGCVVDDAFE